MYCCIGIAIRTNEEGQQYLAVHDVFFNASGKIVGVSLHPTAIEGGDLAELADQIAVLEGLMEKGDFVDYENVMKIGDGEDEDEIYSAPFIPEQNCETSYAVN